MGDEAAREVPGPPANAGEMLARGRAFLGRKGLEQARLEAELLVAHALGLDRLHLFLELERPVTPAEIDLARELLVRRAAREPTAYVTGTREFYGRAFGVGPGVLIPRPESELLVDLARERLAGREAPRVADVGTGSGCLAITIALEHPGALLHALDSSATALERARANGAALGAELKWLEGDGPPALASAAPLDLIVSNPPYIRPDELVGLAPEVRDWEPHAALLLPPGEPDHWLVRLLDEALPLLAPAGSLLVELGAEQAARARELCAERGLEPRLHADLAGIERVLEVPA